MSATVRFTKMHGLGNDYVYIATPLPVSEAELPALSRRLSDRHRSIGGDGMILVLPSETADFRMRIFNADGSEARMCGNGSRCVGKLVFDSGMTDKTELTLETLSGIRHLRLFQGPDGKIHRVSVDMGVGAAAQPVILQAMEVNPVNMGNPHGVVFIAGSPDDFSVHATGALLEHDPYFPDRANIEFAQVIDRSHVRMRVWERGSGETMACGTGACAVAVAAVNRGLTDRKVTVTVPGGDLEIEVTESGRVLMTGPAETSFTGSIQI